MLNVSTLQGHASRAVDDVAPWIERLARLGFAAKAVLYMTVGALAARAALGLGGNATPDSRAAMRSLLEQSYGRVLVGIVAIGLIGYAAWRIVEGVKDPERRGRGAKGIAMRARSIGTGILHAGLALSAVRLAMYQADSGGGQQKSWAARALATPGGEIALWGVALALMGYGVYQIYKGVKAKLDKRLTLGRMSYRARHALVAVSRFGIAARGVVFGAVGLLIMRAAQQHDPNEAGGIREALRELIALGQWPFVAISVGLIAYGVYQLIEARYRRIHVS